MSDYDARSPDTNQTGHRRAIIPANAAEIRDEGGALLEFDVFCCNETRTEIMNRYRNVCPQATRQYEKCGLVPVIPMPVVPAAMMPMVTLPSIIDVRHQALDRHCMYTK